MRIIKITKYTASGKAYTMWSVCGALACSTIEGACEAMLGAEVRS